VDGKDKPRPEYDRFKALAKRIVVVPKREADAAKQASQEGKSPSRKP
jgi:hypothetical protein